MPITNVPVETSVSIPTGRTALPGDLAVPEAAHGLVIFAHGSGSGRHSPRNRMVAQRLQDAGFATLLFDLLTEHEAEVDAFTRQFRFEIPFLARRLDAAVEWVAAQPELSRLPIGFFGASTGAAAALASASHRPLEIAAVVSRGGRPDLAGALALGRVAAPTLLIVGGLDHIVLALNQQALAQLGSREKEFAVVPAATHLFSEAGTLERAADLAADWFARHLAADRCDAARPAERG